MQHYSAHAPTIVKNNTLNHIYIYVHIFYIMFNQNSITNLFFMLFKICIRSLTADGKLFQGILLTYFINEMDKVMIKHFIVTS